MNRTRPMISLRPQETSVCQTWRVAKGVRSRLQTSRQTTGITQRGKKMIMKEMTDSSQL